MGLIECPHCRGLVSDKAIKCVHCGVALKPTRQNICFECGAPLHGGEPTCAHCGCPIDTDAMTDLITKPQLPNTGDNQKRRGSSAKFMLVAVPLLIVLFVVFIGVYQHQKKAAAEAFRHNEEVKAAEEALRRSQEYAQNLELATNAMLTGAADAEARCNLIQQVWHNAIWQTEDTDTDKFTKPDGIFADDFNDALHNLYADSDFNAKIETIVENRETVNAIIAQLKNPPDEYQAAYESLSEYYDAYLTFTSLAINATGSLNTFTAEFDAIDAECLHCYQVMQFYLQD